MNKINWLKNVNFLLKIKYLINNEGYVDCIIIGYSSDDDFETKEKFMNAGCSYVETKPSSFDCFRKII